LEDRPTVYVFDGFEVDERLQELRREGRRVELHATPLRLLLYLLRNRDRVVPADELLDRIWPEVVVSESALSTALKKIRHALEDTGSEQRVIQTLRGQGYRLIAPVEERPGVALAGSHDPQASTPPPNGGAVSRPRRLVQEIHRRSLWQVLGIYLVGAWVAFQGIEALADGLAMPEWVPGFAVVVLILGLPIVLATAFVQEGVGAREVPGEAPVPSEAQLVATPADAGGLHLVLTWRNLLLGGAVVVALAGIAAAVWLLVAGGIAPPPQTIRSVAVLPFADMSPGGDQEYFADGMSEELINRLSRIEDLRVVARTSAFAFKGKNADIREIGEQLDVGAVVEGSVRKAGDRLRITAQLVQVADGYHLWSETYDRQLDDVFAIQDEVSRAIAGALKARLGTTRASKPHTESLRAYEQYLMGRFFWNQRTEEGLRKAIKYFEQALALDPEYALAYSGLADAYCLLRDWGYDTSEEVRSKAADYATEALALDEALAEAHTSLGLILINRLEWVEAERELRRAVELNPSYAPAHHRHGRLLMYVGRREEAVAAVQRAVEVDPLSPSINANAGQLLVAAREFDAAIERLNRAFELSPNLPVNYRLELAYAYVRRGKEEEALETFLGQRFPSEVEAALRDAYRRDGLQAVVRESLELQIARTQKPCTDFPNIGATLFAFLEETDQALGCLEQVLEEGISPQLLKLHPIYDGLRSDPRFIAIVKSMGLDD
jgi:serine/threonine-protein kinase